MRARVRQLPVLQWHPIIAAVREVGLMEKAAMSPVRAIFLMTGDIFTLEECIKIARSAGKAIFLHVDLIHGIASDREGIRYIARALAPDGIVSTKSHLLQHARKEHLLTVQHVFLIDTHAYETGVRSIRDFEPDAVELMPGLMPRVVSDVRRSVACPIVTAGLIKHVDEVARVIEAGASAAAIGKSDLWATPKAEIASRVAAISGVDA